MGDRIFIVYDRISGLTGSVLRGATVVAADDPHPPNYLYFFLGDQKEIFVMPCQTMRFYFCLQIITLQ